MFLFSQVPYNMERLFYLLTDGDTQRVATMMAEMEDKGHITVPKDIHDKVIWIPCHLIKMLSRQLSNRDVDCIAI